MRTFDRAAEMIGDERAAEMRELIWFRELLSVERGFEFGDDVDDADETDWSLVDARDVGHYWELNDGVGREYGLSASRKMKKAKYGWIIVEGKRERKAACGEVFNKYDVCECASCDRRDQIGAAKVARS